MAKDANNNISLAVKLDKILDQLNESGVTDEDFRLNKEEREAMLSFAKNLVAFKRMRKAVIYVLVFLAVVRSQWDQFQTYMIKLFGGEG